MSSFCSEDKYLYQTIVLNGKNLIGCQNVMFLLSRQTCWAIHTFSWKSMTFNWVSYPKSHIHFYLWISWWYYFIYIYKAEGKWSYVSMSHLVGVTNMYEHSRGGQTQNFAQNIHLQNMLIKQHKFWINLQPTTIN